jgi:glutamyl-tRNA synthetase
MRTRIAPTPSGFLHLGNIYSFRLTANLAREKGAVMLLRIDDLDRDRVEERYVRDIFETLHYLGIDWQEGPTDYNDYLHSWSQIHRMPLYRDALRHLTISAPLFACTCSRTEIARHSIDGGYPGTCRNKEIPLDTEGVSWRIRTDHIDPSVRDFMVRKKDGMPAYQLTSLIDDLHFNMNLIVRGEDLRPSTEAQRYLSHFIPGGEAFRRATILHHPLMPDPHGGKLSKSAGSTSIQYLIRLGHTRQEILTMATVPDDTFKFR